MNEIYGRVPGGEKYLSLPLICGLAKISSFYLFLRFFLDKSVRCLLLSAHSVADNGIAIRSCEEGKYEFTKEDEVE